MKTRLLLIILLLGGICQAQIDTIPPTMIRGVSVQDLIDYQKECYNDSTYIAERWEEYEEYPGDLVYRIKQIPAHYTHKKPTFEGFIEYMKRKTR